MMTYRLSADAAAAFYTDIVDVNFDIDIDIDIDIEIEIGLDSPSI